MTPSSPADSARQELLEEVLGDYMQRLDRGEAVDRQQFLARHPELADDLRSYFAGSDEVARLHRPLAPEESGGKSPTAPFPPASPTSSGPRLPAARRVGDYDLLEQIGEGGMGIIYRARQRSLQRVVALKMIRTDRLASPAAVLRFRSEAEAVASLDHPNILPIYEVDEHEGQPFFSMKLIEGGSLADAIADRQLPTMDWQQQAARLLAQIARAVHHAHQRGILHRDLKPANILLASTGVTSGELIPHVTDFGLAKRLGMCPGDASLTQPGAIVGTPNYMAPEQAAGAGVSTATDTYSLGAILYELLTGQPPFHAESPLETLLQLRDREPPPPRSLNRQVDRDLETVCLKCLHKEPPQRYPSAEALADDLDRWLRGEPIQARPVSRFERLRKWVWRRPALASLSALLGLALLAGLADVCWQWRKAVALAEVEQRTAYARAVALAYAEWRAGNAGPAEQVLAACHPELRGWEWHYLQRLFQARQVATLLGHTDAVLAVAFSPDGRHIASAGADGLVLVWDRQTSNATLRLSAHAARVTAVTYSPDGSSLASGADNGSIRIWDAAGGKVKAAWKGHAAGVTGLAFAPDGRRLASTGKGKPSPGELKLWDPVKGKELLSRAWPSLLQGVAFSPDGKSLVTAGRDWSVTEWNGVTVEPFRTLVGQTQQNAPWASVVFSADGRWVGAGSPEGLVRVWDRVPGAGARERFSALSRNQAGVSGLAFCGPDGRLLAAATADNTIQGWFTRSGKPAFTLRGHTRAVRAVASSPDGTCLASASLDGAVKLWDLSRRDDDLTLRWPNQGVTGIAFSPDGTCLASATRDRGLSVWDLATGRAVFTRSRLRGAVTGLALSPDGDLIAATGTEGTVRVWEIASVRERLCLPAGGPAQAVAFGPRGDQIATAGAGGVRVWEFPSGQERHRLHVGHQVNAVTFSPDGRHLAAGGTDGWRVWGTTTGKELLAFGAGPVYALAFSSDGRHLAAAGKDETIGVHEADTGTLLQTLRGHRGAVLGLAYGPGGRLASVGEDRVVRLWDGAGRELLAIAGHTRSLRAVAFSRDGHRLASAGDDGTVKVWDGRPLARSPE